MTEKRAKNGQFLPGTVHNPHGRPKIPADVKEAIKAACPEAVRVLIELLHSKKEAYRLEAAKTLLDRGYGKPESMSKIELSGSNDGAFVFRWIVDEKTGNEDSPK